MSCTPIIENGKRVGMICGPDHVGRFCISGPRGRRYIVAWDFGYFRPYFELVDENDNPVPHPTGGDLMTLDDRFSRKVWRRWQRETPDMRTGWLIWKLDLSQFLYFEERMHVADPDNCYAEWHDSGSDSSTRKKSKNLWVFDKRTRQKVYSITTSAGAKIQPYFVAPPATDPNVYLFTILGEPASKDQVRVWMASATRSKLEAVVGSLDPVELSEFVDSKTKGLAPQQLVQEAPSADHIAISAKTYARLKQIFPGVNDDHSFQRLIAFLAKQG